MPVGVTTAMHDRKVQRALMQFFTQEYYFAVREASVEAGRGDLIGDGCDCLITAQPPKAALAARRDEPNKSLKADCYHAVPAPAKTRAPTGSLYRPGRNPQRRWPRTG